MEKKIKEISQQLDKIVGGRSEQKLFNVNTQAVDEHVECGLKCNNPLCSGDSTGNIVGLFTGKVTEKID
jgi:hypothetical protein